MINTKLKDILSVEQGVASPLRQQVGKVIAEYLCALDGCEANDVYAVVLGEIERVLFQVVMQHVGDNQSKAAAILGVSRGTLRKKLLAYKLI